MRSIDVEALDLQVLKGAVATLAKARIAIVEHEENDHEPIPFIK